MLGLRSMMLLVAALAGVSSLAPANAAELKTAVFAAGCFWCVEEAFDKAPGVRETISGYTGGEAGTADYKQVSGGGTGHYEAVEVRYDPAEVTYEQLLDVFWHNTDPFDTRGQFCDKGSQYLSAIFVASEEERAEAEATKAKVSEQFNMPVATEILPQQAFYPAEDYHQDFYKKSSAHYTYYKWGCGRAQRLEEIWGKPAA